jgi:hypothetical protein
MLKEYPHVIPMKSNRSDKPVANQYVIFTEGKVHLQSYSSTIATYNFGKKELTIGKHFDYSRTTLKYLHDWMEIYCGTLLNSLTVKGSFKATLVGAMDYGIIKYDEEME